MIFTDLPTGATVFLDANVLVYYFEPHPQFSPPCTELLERIENQELTEYTSTHVLAEMTHRLMTLEACATFGWPFAGIAQKLKRDPARVQSLTRFRRAVREVPQYRVRMLLVPETLGDAAAAVSQQTGLLTNDALLAAMMRHHGIVNLASNDGDFDRVPWLTRFAPL